jgi:predicted nucleotidyltransferase
VGAVQSHPAIEWLVSRLGELPSVERVVLFGSRARGDAGPRSDIDLAIDAPGASPELWQRMLDLADEAPTLLRIDIVRIDRVSPAMQSEIIRDGVVLFAQPARTAKPA